MKDWEKEFDDKFPYRGTAICIHAHIGDTKKKLDEIKEFIRTKLAVHQTTIKE